jgi:hypothetical protein
MFSVIQILMWVLMAAGCLVVGREIGKLVFKSKKDVSGLRKATQALSIALREHGLKRLPEALEAFTVGDLDDLLAFIRDAATVVKSGNAAIIAELEGTFDRMLGVKLQTPEGRAALKARVAEVEAEIAAAAPAVVAAAALLPK